jgi:predicted  nucleic acid-binding Zn-ribbon protein
MSTAQETPITRRRSSRAVGNGDVKPSSATRRGRGVRQPTESVLADLDRTISALIKENRELHRRIDRLSKQALDSTSGTAERALRSLQRRISSAIDSRATRRRQQSGPAAIVSRAPRKITDPEVLERRRQALVKARAARAAKRASGQQQPAI